MNRPHRDLSEERAGNESVPELCASLDDPDPETRIRAARSLGRIGDERAIEPLTDALADLSEARYAGVRRRRTVARATLGVLLVTGVAGFFSQSYYYRDIPRGGFAAFLLWLIYSQPVLGCILLGLTVVPLVKLLRWRSIDAKRMAAVASIADALGAIAARHPSPDLRGALADLSASRAAAGRASAEWLPTIDRAIERIEEATAEVQQLPLPSEQSGTPLPELPVPAAGIPDAIATRPRPSAPRDGP